MEILIVVIVVIVVAVAMQRHSYYAGSPWRKVLFRIRTIYDIEHAKASARDPALISSREKWLGFLRRFYRVVYPGLSEDEVRERFDQIEQSMSAFSDRDAIESIIRMKFPQVDEARLSRLLQTFNNDLNHPDNELAILKIFVLADIIGRETDQENRHQFLWTAVAERKSINL